MKTDGEPMRFEGDSSVFYLHFICGDSSAGFCGAAGTVREAAGTIPGVAGKVAEASGTFPDIPGTVQNMAGTFATVAGTVEAPATTEQVDGGKFLSSGRCESSGVF